MIDRDIDLTEDFVFVRQDKINKKIYKNSNVFDESIKKYEKTTSYFNKILSKDSELEDISNFVENLIVTNSLYNYNDYCKYIDELSEKKIIDIYQLYMLECEATESDVFCEECGVYLKNNQLGQLVRAYGVCLECT